MRMSSKIFGHSFLLRPPTLIIQNRAKRSITYSKAVEELKQVAPKTTESNCGEMKAEARSITKCAIVYTVTQAAADQRYLRNTINTDPISNHCLYSRIKSPERNSESRQSRWEVRA